MCRSGETSCTTAQFANNGTRPLRLWSIFILASCPQYRPSRSSLTTYTSNRRPQNTNGLRSHPESCACDLQRSHHSVAPSPWLKRKMNTIIIDTSTQQSSFTLWKAATPPSVLLGSTICPPLDGEGVCRWRWLRNSAIATTTVRRQNKQRK